MANQAKPQQNTVYSLFAPDKGNHAVLGMCRETTTRPVLDGVGDIYAGLDLRNASHRLR